MADLATADDLFAFIDIDERIHLHRNPTAWVVVQMRSDKCLDEQQCAIINLDGPLIDPGKEKPSG